jgi:hypothetical protein
LDLFHITGDSGHDLPSGPLIKIIHGLINEMFKKIIPESFRGAVTDSLHDQGREKSEQSLSKNHDNDQERKKPQDILLRDIQALKHIIH